MTDSQTPKALLTTDKATLIDLIGDKDESIFVAFMEIHSEFREEAKRRINAGVHGKKVVE